MSLRKFMIIVAIFSVMNKQAFGSETNPYLLESIKDKDTIYSILTESSTSGQQLLIEAWHTKQSLLKARFKSWTQTQKEGFRCILSSLNIKDKQDIATILGITLIEAQMRKTSTDGNSNSRFDN